MSNTPHNVLLVDDEFAALEVLALLLGAEGFAVVTASNGDEALERLKEAHVHLVISDYKMPKMDGIELCRRMLADERTRSIPVILCSATYGADLPRPQNVASFLRKPLLFRNLLAEVERILNVASSP